MKDMKKNLSFLVLALLFINPVLYAQYNDCKVTIVSGLDNEYLKLTIQRNVSNFLTSCNEATCNDEKPKLNKNEVTNDARNRLVSLWKTSAMSCPEQSLERICINRPAGGYQIRNIPMLMKDAPKSDQNQEIVLNITADGKVDDIYIPVPVQQYTNLMTKELTNNDPDQRLMVLDFVENFRTAYNRKDIDFLQTVFSNNAVIITGKVIKEKPNSDNALRRSLSTEQITYQIQTKEQYLKKLKNVFKVNKYIHLEFEDIVIAQKEDLDYRNIYGVSFKQKWDSSSYGDAGFVFLIIDFRDKNQPEIYVRTWQPEKYNGRTLTERERFQLGNFSLNIFNY